MNPFWIILIVVLGMIYLISPYDLIPDFMPILGRIDDIGLTVLLIYYLKTGRMPGFVSRILGWVFGTGKSGAAGAKTGAKGDGSAGSSRSGSGKKNPYAVLGLSPGASNKEIHEAYRRLAQQYHPDKVSHLGEEFQELARQKFIEIQQAYEELTGKSG